MPVGTVGHEVAFLGDRITQARRSTRSDLDLIEHVDRVLEVLHGWTITEPLVALSESGGAHANEVTKARSDALLK